VEALFTTHNEHLLVTSKLVSLAGFAINGYWDVNFLVVASALVRAAEATMLFHIITRGLTARANRCIWAACAITFAAPLSGYNILCGHQISFYFAEFAFLWSIHIVLHWNSPWVSGWRLFFATVLGLCSMGSAIAIPMATLAVHFVAAKRHKGFYSAWSATFAATCGYALVFAGESGSMGHSQTHVEQLSFFLQLVSWPLSNRVCGVVVSVLATFAVIWLGRRKQGAPALPAIVGFGVFSGCNAAFIALRRVPTEFHQRHWESVALIPLCLFALCVLLVAEYPRLRSIPGRVVLGITLSVYLMAYGTLIWRQSWPYIASAAATRDTALEHYRTLLLSRRLAQEGTRLEGLLQAHDYSFFDDPIGRFSIHPVVIQNILINRPAALAILAPEVIPVREVSIPSKLIRGVTNAGWILGIAGIVTAINNVFKTWRARRNRLL
jgi:hypothetical protein